MSHSPATSTDSLQNIDETFPPSVFKQAEEIADMFSTFDKDGNGSLDFEEIKVALR